MNHFDYDKLIKKLEKFKDLSGKKQRKAFDTIFISDEFRNWFYGIGENSNSQPMTSPMVNKLFTLLASPSILKKLTKYVEESNGDKFDHTSHGIMFLVVEQAVESANSANEGISVAYKNGEISSKDAKEFKVKSERYSEMISELTEAIREKTKPEIKDICKKSNLPRGLVYTTYLMIPGRNFIPKYKIGMYMNQILQEIYKWVGINGVEDVSMIKWGPYFGNFFGSSLTTSSAISILLEGVKRIDPYREAEHFDDVRSIWDSLTSFAMNELDNAPENVRRQMIELYVKKIDKIFRNGNNPRLRVDMLKIPNDFKNLSETLSRYSNKIAKITRQGIEQTSNVISENKPKDTFEGVKNRLFNLPLATDLDPALPEMVRSKTPEELFGDDDKPKMKPGELNKVIDSLLEANKVKNDTQFNSVLNLVDDIDEEDNNSGDLPMSVAKLNMLKDSLGISFSEEDEDEDDD